MMTETRTVRARGFTLVEVLIVLAIIVSLGGLVAYNLLPQRDRANNNIMQAQLDIVEDALEQFYVDLDRYPTEDEGIAVLWDETLLEDEADQEKWTGPYLKEPIENDYWGNPWNYRFPGELDETMYQFWSNGKDGEEGTEDDIKSWRDDEDTLDMGTGG